jgi:dTDP-4-dehydrorhamnose reductase
MLNKKILILGSTGMLSSMLIDYFSREENFDIACTYNNNRISEFCNYDINEYKLDVSHNVEEGLQNIIINFKPDFVINCIGIIKPYCKDDDPEGVELAVRVNSLFPYILSDVLLRLSPKARILQIATDCVYDGLKGAYKESDKFSPDDVYGRSKSLGEPSRTNLLNIRTSIIGPEIKGYTSLLEWFLRTNDISVNGFEHHRWNGVTTLQFAQLCRTIIVEDLFDFYRSKASVFHYVINNDVSKFELLNIFKNIFNTSHNIKKVTQPLPSVDRTLRSELFEFPQIKMEESIQELYNYMHISRIFGD